MERRDKSRLKLSRVALSATAFFGLSFGIACGESGGNPDEEPQDPVPGEGIPPEEGRFLDLPFPPDKDMMIQQAWTSSYDARHEAMDIIKGSLDNSATWESFPVLAGADGLACANPENKQGNAVKIEHKFEDITIFEYSGHLKSIAQEILLYPCEGSERKEVKKGERVGDAGSTDVVDEKGISQPLWIHIHWRIFDENNNSIDPFDIYSERKDYPNINNPKYTNGKICGKNTILIDCPTEAVASKSPKKNLTPPPLVTRPVPTVPPSPTPVFTQEVTSPSPAKTPEATQRIWKIFTSSEHNYRVEYRMDWWTNNGPFSVGDSASIEYFNGPQINNHSVGIGIVSQRIDESFEINEYIDSILDKENGFIINSQTTLEDEPNIGKISDIKIDGSSVIAVYIDAQNYTKNRIVFERNGKIWNIILTYGKNYSTEDLEYIRDETLIHMINSVEFLD